MLAPENPRHLYRHILRQTHILHDDIARTHVARLVRTRFETRTSGAHQLRQRFKRARNFLSTLQRANAGVSKPLEKVLKLGYGRIGPRWHELMKPILSHPVPRAPEPLIPGNPRSTPPAMSEPLAVLLRWSGVQKIKPRIPEFNIWMRPFPKNREANMRWRHHTKVVALGKPPLPAEEFRKLEGYASGSLQPEPPRRKKGVEDMKMQGQEWVVARTKVSTDDMEEDEVTTRRIRERPRDMGLRSWRRAWQLLLSEIPEFTFDATKKVWLANTSKVLVKEATTAEPEEVEDYAQSFAPKFSKTKNTAQSEVRRSRLLEQATEQMTEQEILEMNRKKARMLKEAGLDRGVPEVEEQCENERGKRAPPTPRSRVLGDLEEHYGQQKPSPQQQESTEKTESMGKEINRATASLFNALGALKTDVLEAKPEDIGATSIQVGLATNHQSPPHDPSHLQPEKTTYTDHFKEIMAARNLAQSSIAPQIPSRETTVRPEHLFTVQKSHSLDTDLRSSPGTNETVFDDQLQEPERAQRTAFRVRRVDATGLPMHPSPLPRKPHPPIVFPGEERAETLIRRTRYTPTKPLDLSPSHKFQKMEREDGHDKESGKTGRDGDRVKFSAQGRGNGNGRRAESDQKHTKQRYGRKDPEEGRVDDSQPGRQGRNQRDSHDGDVVWKPHAARNPRVAGHHSGAGRKKDSRRSGGRESKEEIRNVNQDPKETAKEKAKKDTDLRRAYDRVDFL